MKNRLRISCLLLAALMLFALAACGKDSPEPSSTPEGSVETKPPVEAENETTINTNLWDLTYDEADGWVYEEEELYDDETYSDLILVIPDETGESDLINVEISVSIEDPGDFRDYLISAFPLKIRGTSATISSATVLTSTNTRSIRPMILLPSAALTVLKPKATIGGPPACGISVAWRAPEPPF